MYRNAMKRKSRYLIVFAALLLGSGILLAMGTYCGSLLGEEHSLDGAYSLRYYKTLNPFGMVWSMPGDAACEPLWIRLYDRKDTKLAEMLTTNCELENEPRWLERELILPDGKTIWKLPGVGT